MPRNKVAAYISQTTQSLSSEIQYYINIPLENMVAVSILTCTQMPPATIPPFPAVRLTKEEEPFTQRAVIQAYY